MLKSLVDITEAEKKFAAKMEVNDDYVIVKPARVTPQKGIIVPKGLQVKSYGYVVKGGGKYQEGDLIGWSDRTIGYPLEIKSENFSENTFDGNWLSIFEKDVIYKLKLS